MNTPGQCFFLFQQINIQNCTGSKPESSYKTLLRNWQLRFLFSPYYYYFEEKVLWRDSIEENEHQMCCSSYTNVKTGWHFIS